MSIEFLGFTIDLIGKVMVGFTAIMVHHRVWKEHRIDEAVFKEMRREQFIGLIGVALIIAGYVLQIPGKI